MLARRVGRAWLRQPLPRLVVVVRMGFRPVMRFLHRDASTGRRALPAMPRHRIEEDGQEDQASWLEPSVRPSLGADRLDRDPPDFRLTSRLITDDRSIEISTDPQAELQEWSAGARPGIDWRAPRAKMAWVAQPCTATT